MFLVKFRKMYFQKLIGKGPFENFRLKVMQHTGHSVAFRWIDLGSTPRRKLMLKYCTLSPLRHSTLKDNFSKFFTTLS